MRIGHGYDVHRLIHGRNLIIGGINIPYIKGLEGHSDADVLIHAVIDALLGAAGIGDIGKLFPDSDSKYKGISSMVLLSETGNIIHSHRFSICNIDSTIIAQKPKLISYIPQMRANLANALGLCEDAVNVKATTEEYLGFSGLGEGIAAHCVCLLE